MGPKERMEYCAICQKETLHVISVYGSPVGFNCSENHPGDDTCCHKCGAPFDSRQNNLHNKLMELIVRIFGPKKIKRFCENCTHWMW